MGNWVALIDAVMEMARRDAAGNGRWASDARAFLASKWRDELEFVSREWKSDNCGKRGR